MRNGGLIKGQRYLPEERGGAFGTAPEEADNLIIAEEAHGFCCSGACHHQQFWPDLKELPSRYPFI